MRGDHTRMGCRGSFIRGVEHSVSAKTQLSLAYRNCVKCVSNMQSIYYHDIVLVWYWFKTRYVTTPIDSVDGVAIGWCWTRPFHLRTRQHQLTSPDQRVVSSVHLTSSADLSSANRRYDGYPLLLRLLIFGPSALAALTHLPTPFCHRTSPRYDTNWSQLFSFLLIDLWIRLAFELKVQLN